LKTWGFARSFVDENRAQNSLQIEALLAAGAEEVVFDYEPWSRKKRRLFEQLLDILTPGDTVIVTEIYRMSSTTAEFGSFVEAIVDRKLRLIILQGITIDCREGSYDAETQAYLRLISIFTALERSKLYTVTRNGTLGKRSARRRIGRPPVTFDRIPAIFFSYFQLYEDGQMNISELARACGLSRPTIYKYKRLVEAEMEKYEEEQHEKETG